MSDIGGIRAKITPEHFGDWIEIHQLLGYYAHALDNRDARLLESLWHPDAVWHFEDENGTHVGLSEINRFANEVAWPRSSITHHLVTNVIIEFGEEGDAWGRSVAYAQVTDFDSQTLFPIIASYKDQYVRYEDRFVFRRREVYSDRSGLA